MSWSVSAIGKADAVALKVSEEFAKIDGYLKEPEKGVALTVAASIAAALAAQAPGTVVNVQASGSQNVVSSPPEGDIVRNRFSASVEVLYGFIESTL